jgi:hypothetical protein
LLALPKPDKHKNDSDNERHLRKLEKVIFCYLIKKPSKRNYFTDDLEDNNSYPTLENWKFWKNYLIYFINIPSI